MSFRRPALWLLLIALLLPSFFAPPLTQATFTDSEADYDERYTLHPYFEGAEYLQELGVLDGYPDGSFKPLSTINRAEFTKIVLNATHPEALSGSDCFTDVADEWFASYVCAAKDLDIIEGYPDGSFKPEATVNFAEAAKILTEAFGIETESTEMEWYLPYVDYMSDNRYFPFSTPGLDFAVNRGEMAEMVMSFLTQERSYGSGSNPYGTSTGGRGLVTIGLGGSCYIHEIQDTNRNPVETPDEVDALFNCGSDVKFFSDNGRYFYYIKSNWEEDNYYTAEREFKVYDFEDGSTTSLVTLYDTTDRAGSVSWNDSESLYSMVVFNFTASDYPTGMKLFVMEIDGETLISKEKFDVKIPYSFSNEGYFALDTPTWTSETTLEYIVCEDPASGGWEETDAPWTIDDLTTVEGCSLETLEF